MASGYKFEDIISDFLGNGYKKIEKNVMVPSGKGERKEVDIIIKENIVPFGEMIFLIECKVPKIDKGLVENFGSKIKAIREGSSEYSQGIPIMIGENGFTETAPDYALNLGIKLISFESIKDISFPKPISIAVLMNRLRQDFEATIYTPKICYTAPNFKSLYPIKSKLDIKMGRIGRVDIYAEFEAKKKYFFLFGFYSNKLKETLLFTKIKKIEDFLVKQGSKLKKKEIWAFVGFYSENLSQEDKKLLGKVKKISDNCKITFIDSNTKKAFGDIDAITMFKI